MRRYLFGPIGYFAAIAVIAGCGTKPAPAPSPHRNKTHAKASRPAPPPTGISAIKPYSAPPAKLPIGNVADGLKIYKASCATCHGSGGTGTAKGSRLASPSDIPTNYTSEAALAVFIAHNMPSTNPGSLSNKDISNVTAYIWHVATGK